MIDVIVIYIQVPRGQIYFTNHEDIIRNIDNDPSLSDQPRFFVGSRLIV